MEGRAELDPQSFSACETEAFSSRVTPLTLLSFEKGGDLRDVGRVDVLRHRLAVAGVRWLPLAYHKDPPVLSTVWDVAHAIGAARREARRQPIRITHARGYVAALVALALRRLIGARRPSKI